MKPRSRIIKPGYFKNEILAEVEPLGRILFAGLWIMADREGRLENRPKRIKAEVLPYDNVDVEPLLKQLHDRGFIICHRTEGQDIISIPEESWEEHQSIHWNEEPSKLPAIQKDSLIAPIKGLCRTYVGSPNKVEVKEEVKVKVKEEVPFGQIIEHLNTLTGKDYKPASRFNRQFIRARWREGYKLEDFFYVNQVKAEEWLGTDKEQFLRPQTLYGTKMESYRQQRKIPRQYSEKTNKALVAAAKYLQKEGLKIDRTGQTEAGGSTPEITGGVFKGHQ